MDNQLIVLLPEMFENVDFYMRLPVLTDSVDTLTGPHNPQQRLQQKLQQQQPQHKQQHPNPNPQPVAQQHNPTRTFLHVDILLNVPGYSNEKTFKHHRSIIESMFTLILIYHISGYVGEDNHTLSSIIIIGKFSPCAPRKSYVDRDLESPSTLYALAIS